MRDAVAIRWEGRPMATPVIPPELAGAGWLAAGASLLFAIWRAWGDWLTGRVTREKLAQERDTAEILGDKAMQEARNAGVSELAAIIAAMRLEVNDLRAALEQERDSARTFRAAVLVFIGRISLVLPTLPGAARAAIQEALDELRANESWER